MNSYLLNSLYRVKKSSIKNNYLIMKIYLKNMVCQGTRSVVILELERLGFRYRSFEANEIDFENDLSIREINQLDESLSQYGLELTFKNSNLVNKIRQAIHELKKKNLTLETSLSYYVSHRIGYNFTLLNTYFRRETGLSIEDYYAELKKENMMLNASEWPEILDPLGKSA